MKRWQFGEALHSLWYGNRIVFDSCRDMGLAAADARRIERLLNIGEAANANGKRTLCCHADQDGRGMHWLEPGEKCDRLEQRDSLAPERVADPVEE